MNIAEPQPSPPRMNFTRIFDDPTPGGIVMGRVMLMLVGILPNTTLTEQEKERLLNICLLVSKKLVATWKHRENYNKILKEEIEREIKKQAEDSINHDQVSQDLFLEFDEFLVQVKSSLDYLVHVPIPIFSEKRWNLRTFGDKGRDVTRAMRRNLPQEKQKQVSGVIKFLFDEITQNWLTMTIDARDKVNHFLNGGIPFEYFSVRWAGDPAQLMVPMWSPDMTVDAFLDVNWTNLLCFIENFIATMLYFRLKPGLAMRRGIIADLGGAVSPWAVCTEDEMNQETSGLRGTYLE